MMKTGLIGRAIVNPIQVILTLETTTKPPFFMPRAARDHENVVRNGMFWLPRTALAITGNELVPVDLAHPDQSDHAQGWFGFGMRREEGFVLPTNHGAILVRTQPDAVHTGSTPVWPHLELFFQAPDQIPEREMLIWAYLKSLSVALTEISEEDSPVIAGYSVHELLQPELLQQLTATLVAA
jgi:hypothetical protein